MRVTYTEHLYIAPCDRHLARTVMHECATEGVDVQYHRRDSCYAISSPRGSYRAVQRQRARMWQQLLNRRK